MRYTIYNLKKKGKNSFFFLLIVILVATIILSTSMFNLWGEKVSKFIMGNSEKQLNIIEEKNQNFSDLSARFLIMQMGAYNSKEGAIQQCDTLKSVINSFVIEDDSKFKIFTGIYDEGNFSEIEEKIVSNGIDAFKITYEITIDEESTYELIEIIKAHIQHLTNLTKSNVESIETEPFKNWIAMLPIVDENSKNYALLEEYKEYINELPSKLQIDKLEENYIYIYNILNKIGNKKI